MKCTECNKIAGHFKSTSTLEDGSWVTRRYYYCDTCKLGFIQTLRSHDNQPKNFEVDNDIEIIRLDKKIVTLDNYY